MGKKTELVQSAHNVWKIKKKIKFQGKQKKEIDNKFSQAVEEEMKNNEYGIKIKL